MTSEGKSFVFPVTNLESSRLRLVPFDLDTHGPAYVAGTKDHPTLFDYMPMGPFASVQDLKGFFDRVMYSTNTRTCFAIEVKDSDGGAGGSLAGMVGYLNASDTDCVTEIGFITILPKYHGTFVAKNATGLLIMYALDPAPHGLGLRRCQWQCHAANEASRRFAAKMLFTYEGTKRFERIMPVGKPGNGFDISSLPGISGKALGPSRDTEVHAHYCDEWEEKRPQVLALMDRK